MKTHTFGILCFIISRKVKTTETQQKIYAVYGESTVTDRMCQKCLERFHAGDFFLDDAPRSGRPVKVDSDHIETLIENSQWYSLWEIADTLKIPKSIRLLVKMKNVSFILWKNLNRLFDQLNK